MQNEDTQSAISFSTLGDYRNEELPNAAEGLRIDDSTIKSILERIKKLEKDNATYRALAFDLQQVKNELTAKNYELQTRVSELEIFKEHTILASQERDFQVEDLRKTIGIFTIEIASLKQVKGTAKPDNEEFPRFQKEITAEELEALFG